MRNYWKVAIVMIIFVGSSQAQSPKQAQQGKQALDVLPRVRVTVLVDNMSGFGPVLGEWGASFLIETNQHRILFDTGAGRVLLGNALALDVNLGKTDAIVISHGHDDHTGGLEKALEVCGPVDLFVHPQVFDTRYWKEDTGAVAYRLPLSRQQLHQRVKNLIETMGSTTICDGLMVTGQVPRGNDFEDTGLREYAFMDERLTIADSILDDQAMFFRVPEGIVILVGCAHSGLVNTMEYVSKLTGEQRIYAVIGGSHLISASPARLKKTIESLRKYDVQKIMLSHCTGVKAFADLACAFPGRCSWPASGTTIKFGSW